MKQLTYKGSKTARLKLMSMIDSGQAEGLSNREIAELIGCTPRTIEAYLRDYNQAQKGNRPLDTDEYDMPLQTTRGMKICHHEGCDDCNKCEMIERCREMVRDGNFAACEVPLAKEVFDMKEWEEEEEEGEKE